VAERSEQRASTRGKGKGVGCSPFSTSITSGKLEQGMDEPGGDIKVEGESVTEVSKWS
jgi:hypothetical protein